MSIPFSECHTPFFFLQMSRFFYLTFFFTFIEIYADDSFKLTKGNTTRLLPCAFISDCRFFFSSVNFAALCFFFHLIFRFVFPFHVQENIPMLITTNYIENEWGIVDYSIPSRIKPYINSVPSLCRQSKILIKRI